MSYYTHSAALLEPETPTGPRPVYPEHRMDFLTVLLEDGTPEFKAYEIHQHEPTDKRARARAANVKAGLTRYLVGVCGDSFDEIGNPPNLVPVLQELSGDGLGPCIAVCPEDSPAMQQKYGDLDYFLSKLNLAIEQWRPWLTEIWIGIEADEVWTPDEILTIARGIPHDWPIVLHLGQGHVVPRGASASWWSAAKGAGLTHLAYQAKHAAVEDSGGAFLSDINTIRTELREAVHTVAGHVHVISSEYAYFGINPSPATVQEVSAAGYALGEKSLEEAGVIGISNGGPGYWPPEAIAPPVGALDDIDIHTVSFYDRSGTAINEIRTWPIESKITPSFPDGGRKVSYQHTATLSWPVWDEDGDGQPDPGGVNSNSWLCMNRGGKWEAYTNDFLRPGSCEKVWAEVNSFDSEPITWGPPKHGETLYLFVTRIARYGTFPTGAGRSNLVMVQAP